MKKPLLWVLVLVMSIALVAFFISTAGCRPKPEEKPVEVEEELVEEEQIEEPVVEEVTDEAEEEDLDEVEAEEIVEEELQVEPDKSIFLSDKNLDDSFIGLSLLEVQKLQQEKGWPPSLLFDPSKAKGFTAKVSKAQVFDKDDNPIDISLIVFNLPIDTEIIAPIEGWLAFGGGSFGGDDRGGSNIFIGLNNILGRIEFSYFLKEPMWPIDMDKLQPEVYSEGSVILKIDNENTTTDFGFVYPDDSGNLVMVMREPSEEYESPLMSMDFNSFLKDEQGRIVYILNQ